jgi:undecaprenyl-diphosphatase
VTLFDVLIVALIRGVGEVLPLGAAGHLALLPAFGTSAERAAIAAAADAGILLALALYFWRDLWAMGLGLWKLGKGRPDSGTRLLLRIVAGTIPALAVSWAVRHWAGSFDGRITAAAAMLVFGLFLLVADKLGMTVRRLEHMNFLEAMAIGLLQGAALIPGVSRVGITVTAARLMGYERREAARFALLLGLPLLAVSAASAVADLWLERGLLPMAELAGAGAAMVSALIATAAMLAWLRRGSYLPFALWRIGVGIGTLALLLVR